MVAVVEFVGAMPNGHVSRPQGISTWMSLIFANVEDGEPVSETTLRPWRRMAGMSLITSSDSPLNENVLRGHHPEIAVHRLHGVEDDGTRPRGRENRAHLLGNVQILADAGDNHDAAFGGTRKNHLHRADEAVTHGVASTAKAFDFDIENLACAADHLFSCHHSIGYLALMKNHLPVLWSNVTQIVPTMSSAEQPRERSFMALASPWRFGPMASAPARRWAIL